MNWKRPLAFLLFMIWQFLKAIGVMLFVATVYLPFSPTICVIDGPGFTSIQTQVALKDIVLGIQNYRTEYNHLPSRGQPNGAKSDQRFETEGDLLAILLGRNVSGLNPREIRFIEPPAAKDGKGGLIEEENKLVDRWGHPYVVWLDANFDDQIDNPDLENTSKWIDHNVSRRVTASAIAYSRGRDGIECTRDDIVSWRPQHKPAFVETLVEEPLTAFYEALTVALKALGAWTIFKSIVDHFRRPAKS